VTVKSPDEEDEPGVAGVVLPTLVPGDDRGGIGNHLGFGKRETVVRPGLIEGIERGRGHGIGVSDSLPLIVDTSVEGGVLWDVKSGSIQEPGSVETDTKWYRESLAYPVRPAERFLHLQDLDASLSGDLVNGGNESLPCAATRGNIGGDSIAKSVQGPPRKGSPSAKGSHVEDVVIMRARGDLVGDDGDLMPQGFQVASQAFDIGNDPIRKCLCRPTRREQADG
jgi:hypothetical protein